MSIFRLFRTVASPLLLACLPSPAAAQDYGLSERPEVAAYYDHVLPPEAPVIASDWTTVQAFPNLSFLNPVGLVAIPGTNKLLVWEREGKVWVFDNNPAVTTKTQVVDLSAHCQGWDDSGLLGLAVHPDFATNRQIFVYYNWRGGVTGGTGDMGPVLGTSGTRPPTNTPTRDRLSRFTLDANYQANAANEYVIIDQKDTSVWHNGGGMFFHPQNGFLYLTNGDDTVGDNTQRIDRSLFSCVIRIDVDQRGGAISHAPTLRPVNEASPTWPRYYVPNDNPFVGQPAALEEIFALGLRSPHRMTVDGVTGRIFIGDVGAETREEVSIIEPNDPPGVNMQWNRIEGLGGDLTAPYIGTNKRPVIDYPHGTDDGSCVVGGYVYRGSLFPELVGKYIFGDNMSGRIWYLDETTTPATKVLLATLPDGPGPNSGNDYRGLGSFGLDAANELYMCRLSSTDGRIYKLQRGGPAPGTPLPATLGATGFFSDLATLTPSPRLTRYDLNAPFWSDGAVKSRFFAIPSGSAVGFQPSGEWAFPEGSVFVKHFELPVSDTDPNVKRRLETRFIVKKQDGSVYGATYKWRADQSDADLLDSSLTESIPIYTAPIGNLTGLDIGSPALSGSTQRNGNLVTITAGGTDIWGTSDQFQFAHQLRTGDFDIAVKVESVTQADVYTKTGLMVRESLAANARHIMALVFPSNADRNNNNGGYEFQYRATTGGNAAAIYPPQPQPRVNYPDTWLRMKREGNTFIAYSGSDGFTWSEYARTTMNLPAEIRFGLAVCAHTASPRTTAKFQIETRRQPWYYPSRQNCVTCHNTQAGGVLGLSTRQLNKDLLFPTTGVTDNQLRAWNHVGLFENGPVEANIPALEKLVHYSDTSATLEKRARSYLDANCSSCHRPGGVQAFWDARFGTPFVDQGIYYGPVTNNLGTPDARVVVPQDLVKSILYRRVSITGQNQMPPLAKNLVDHGGVAVLQEWIQSLQVESVSAPDVLVATGISHTQVDLSWQDLSGNEAGFSIERSIDGINFSPLAITGPDVTSYSDTTAEPFTTNYYRVSAFGSYVYSSPTNVASAVTDIGPPAPEVRVVGNGRIIAKNDLTPQASDGTDFGVLVPPAAATHSFTLQNIGNSQLQLTGTPRIQISGAGASSFLVLAQPPASLAGPGLFNFQIRFAPQGTGVKSATVTISSDDPDEGSSSFVVTGVGVSVNLAGWWKFDESSGTSAADATGAGRTGTLVEPLPTWKAAGHFGGALHFTGQINQSVTVDNHASLNPTAEISITAWIYANDWTGNRRIMQKGNGDNQYRLLAENNHLVWDINDVGRLEADLPPVNTWCHVAATYNGSAMKLFVNGVVVASEATSGAIPTTTDPLYIGTKTPGSVAGDHFNGDLDDVRLFARALSADEVGTLAAQDGAVSIAVNDGIARKGVADTAAFTVTRTGPTDSVLQVGLTVASGVGQATPGADYTLSPAFTGFAIPAGQSSANIVVNPLDRAQVTGPQTVMLSLGEASGYILGGTTSAQVQILDSPLNQWKFSAFGSLAAAQGAAAADTADDDADGLNVLLEGALGGSPFADDSRLQPKAQVEFVDGDFYLTCTYVRPRPVLGGITLVHRTNFDLTTGTWAPAVAVAGYPQDNGNGTETVKVRAAEPAAANPKQFIRLEVSRP